MICSLRSHRNTRQLSRARLSRGFTLLELLIVVGIVIILSALASTCDSKHHAGLCYALSHLLDNRSDFFHSPHQAIFNGCQSQLVITKANFSYQIQSENPGVGGATCNAAFAQYFGGLTPFQGKSIALNSDITLTFRPSGAVASTPVANRITLILSNTAPGLDRLLPENIQGVNLWKHHCHAISRAAMRFHSHRDHGCHHRSDHRLDRHRSIAGQSGEHGRSCSLREHRRLARLRKGWRISAASQPAIKPSSRGAV